MKRVVLNRVKIEIDHQKWKYHTIKLVSHPHTADKQVRQHPRGVLRGNQRNIQMRRRNNHLILKQERILQEKQKNIMNLLWNEHLMKWMSILVKRERCNQRKRIRKED